MTKKIIRLTEGDLHKIIKESIKQILKEDFDNMDYVSDIINGEFDKNQDVEDKDGYYEIYLICEGQSGTFYNIYVDATYTFTHGAKSRDYDVPDDSDEFEIQIEKIIIKKFDEGLNDEIDLNYDNRCEELNDIIKEQVYEKMSYIDLDYTDELDDFYASQSED